MDPDTIGLISAAVALAGLIVSLHVFQAKRLDRIDARLDQVDSRLSTMDARINGIDNRLSRIEGRMQGWQDRPWVVPPAPAAAASGSEKHPQPA